MRDTGTGMDEQTRRRCLEPFFSTKGEQGNGLGLAMVYGMLKRHGGEIEIVSEPGRGTTMRLQFPIDSARASVSKLLRHRRVPSPAKIPVPGFSSPTMTPCCSSHCAPPWRPTVTT